MTSPAPASQPTPTEAEYAVAQNVTTAWETSGEGYGGLDDRIAQALADQRAELVGRYEAVAAGLITDEFGYVPKPYVIAKVAEVGQ